MILLTGGAGFIGSCLLRKFNDNGINDIIVVDHLGKEDKWKNLVRKRFDKFIAKDDLFFELSSDNRFNNLETIIHLGACTVTTETDSDYIIENNLNYSIDLAEYAIENDIQFIYASSASTYGNGQNGYSDSEYYDLQPMNPYGLSKQLFDLWVLDHGFEDKFTGLKFFNVFGPNEYHKDDMASMIFKAYSQIMNTGKVKLFKSNDSKYLDGEQKRDFIYVKDVVEVLWNVYNDLEFSGIYNLGTGKARTWNSLITAVFSALGKKSNIEYIDMPEKLKTQYQNFTEADMSKLNNTKNSFEFLSLEDSVKDYVLKHLSSDWKYL